jgi:hypothetical protein
VSNAAQLPDSQTAYNNLFEGVHARIFFAKCASAGIYPRNQAEAGMMLETAGKLRQLAEAEQVKTAAAHDSPFYRMNAGLDNVLSQYGINAPRAGYQEQESAIKQAAAELSADPTFYNSVLALKAEQAEALKAQYEATRAAQG